MSSTAARSNCLSLAIAALIFGAACSEPAPPPPPPAPPVKTAEQRVQIYQACWDQFNNKAWDQFQNCYTENAVSENPDGNPASITGRTAIVDRDKMEVAAFPDRRGEVQLILANGERIASVALYTATNTGAMPPGPDGKAIPATNKAVGFYIAHTLDFDPTGSMAARDAGYIDEGTMTAQLGLNPAPARPAMKATGAAATVVIAKNDDKEHANIDAIRKSFAALNAHDAKGVLDTMAPTYKSIEIPMAMDMDKKASEGRIKELFVAFPDVRITPVTMWAAGDYVVVSGTFEGTNTGDMASAKMKKTGKKISMHFLEVFKVDNGLCTEDWLFYNGAVMAAQLGMK